MEAITAYTKAVTNAETRAQPYSEVYRGCLKLDEALDGMALTVTGDPAYFHIKVAPGGIMGSEKKTDQLTAWSGPHF